MRGPMSNSAADAQTQMADARLAQYLTAQSKKHYEGALARLTSFSWIQTTIGIGFKVVDVPFDVAFSAEPVFSCGAALLSITAGAFMPHTQALVMYWIRDPKSGTFTGAAVAVDVELRFHPGFYLSKRDPAGSDIPVATVSHHLTFTGTAIPVAKKGPATKAGPKKTGMTP